MKITAMLSSCLRLESLTETAVGGFLFVFRDLCSPPSPLSMVECRLNGDVIMSMKRGFPCCRCVINLAFQPWGTTFSSISCNSFPFWANNSKCSPSTKKMEDYLVWTIFKPKLQKHCLRY